MRHRKAGYKLNRTTAHRTAMLRNLAASLFEHGQVTTTIPKAKAVQPLVERIVTKAKKGGVHSRRQVASMLGGNRKGFDWLHIPKGATETERDRIDELRERAEGFFDLPESDEIERNRYGELRRAPRLVRHIFDNVAPRFEDRAGGYTRIIKLGYHRVGDAAELCVIQFVGNEEGPEIGGGGSTRRKIADKRTAFAAKLRKESGAKEESSAVATEEPPVEAAVEEPQVEEAQGEATTDEPQDDATEEKKDEN